MTLLIRLREWAGGEGVVVVVVDDKVDEDEEAERRAAASTPPLVSRGVGVGGVADDGEEEVTQGLSVCTTLGPSILREAQINWIGIIVSLWIRNRKMEIADCFCQ